MPSFESAFYNGFPFALHDLQCTHAGDSQRESEIFPVMTIHDRDIAAFTTARTLP